MTRKTIQKLMWVVMLCGAVAACSPRVQTDLPDVETPHIHADTARVADGTALPLRRWLPAASPKAIILAVHGFNDYSNAFEGVGKYFRKRGVAVYAYDQRGFGATQEKGIWGGDKNLTGDLRDIATLLRKLHPGAPLYILGESMGGAVVIAALDMSGFPKVDGIILSAPAVWGSETLNAFYRSTLWLLAHTMPGKEVTGEGLKILASDNIEMLRALGRDPLVIKKTRVDAVYGVVGLMDDAYEKVDDIDDIPVLFLYGQRDQVIPPNPVRKTIHRLRAPHRVAYYPSGYHMLLRDLKAEVVLGDIAFWLNNKKAALPSGYEKDWEGRMKHHVLTSPKKSPKGKDRWPSRKRR